MTTNPKKILIVDDERDLVSLVALHMQMAGFGVLFAYDGRSALEICRDERPDAVILDLMLPKLSGWEVCRRLREDPAMKEAAILMLSARDETEDKVMGFDAGADDYVTKPFSPRELVARVRRILARHHNLQQENTSGDSYCETNKR